VRLQQADSVFTPRAEGLTHPFPSSNPKNRRIPAFSFFSASPTLAKPPLKLHFPRSSHRTRDISKTALL
jgi:hypothetical protein